jgi:feruloyl esterase
MSVRYLLASAAALTAVALASPSWAGQCETLTKLKLRDTVIKSAETIPEGGFVGMGAFRRPDLPAFCRVVAAVRAAPDSDVGVEIWLPETHWTGIFHGNGNGGFGGVLAAGYGNMAAGLRRGYATAVTDTGTAPATPLDGDALIGHPRKWKDWGRLSTHVMTVTGKAIAKAYYGEPAKRAYYTGCSTGGQEGLIEALYYPDDYDGVLVGAPVVNRTWGHAAVLWDDLTANREAGHALSDSKLALLHSAVLAACAGHGDNLAGDSFVSDPTACRFAPEVLTCSSAQDATCLTPSEVDTANAFYSGPTNKTGKPIFYGWPLGSEAPGRFGWNFLQSRPGGEPAFDSVFKWVFGPNWDPAKFDFERDMFKVDAVLGPAVNDATMGDLAAFKARGGKLIIYQGWADSLVPPDQTIAFYNRVAGASGGMTKAHEFARLFMAPGVMHCGGGSGADGFNAANAAAPPPASEAAKDDLFTALSTWVEGGAAPDQVIATRYIDGAPAKGVAAQRPLCAYPAKAWYREVGSASEARSFTCSVSKPPSSPS